MKKVILVLAAIFFALPFHYVFAGLLINEIMYDLSGADSVGSKSREWTEVYNPDASDVSVDASKWRIHDGSANRTINGEVDFSIPGGAYIIFAGDKDTFLSDYPSFSGVVYDTGIASLNNTGATLKILDQDGNMVDSVAYTSAQGGAGDGNSLQKKISGTWQGAMPTPGMANETTSPSVNSSTAPISSDNNSSSSNTNTKETRDKTIEEPKVKTKIITQPLAFIGVPTFFQATAFGLQGEALNNGKYFWNFGDGDSKEVKANENQKFTHIYFYAGEHVVTLEYYSNYYSNIPDASSKIVIKVVPADIIISKVGNEKDFFIELSNNTNYDTDISNWILVSDAKSFTIPRNTTIISKNKIIISSKITNFSMADKNNLKLLNPQGAVVFDYPASLLSTPTVSALAEPAHDEALIVVPPSTNQVRTSSEKISEEKVFTAASPEAINPLENLVASPVLGDVMPEDSDNSFIPAVIFFALLSTSAGAVYFIRQKRTIPKVGDDFKLLDE